MSGLGNSVLKDLKVIKYKQMMNMNTELDKELVSLNDSLVPGFGKVSKDK